MFELEKELREDLEEYQDHINKIGIRVNKVKAGIKTANELFAASNALMASAAARMESSNALMKSSNARIEAATLEKKLALEKLNGIKKSIAETRKKINDTSLLVSVYGTWIPVEVFQKGYWSRRWSFPS